VAESPDALKLQQWHTDINHCLDDTCGGKKNWIIEPNRIIPGITEPIIKNTGQNCTFGTDSTTWTGFIL